ncbi:MAG: helix-turn-helix domain-containing protein [Chromatiales bacterium]|nr:helix-turn-helix domain-containing protein [Chromatiales bacterium]
MTMNAVETDEPEVVAEVDGPGKQLKSIREERGLDLVSVAAMLHLSDSKLEALESDDYEALPGAVFIQGYLRNYARVLEVPVEPILAAYQQANPSVDQQPDLKVGRVNHEVRSSHGLVRMMTWIIVLSLIGLVLTWWQGYLQWPLFGDQAQDEAPSLEESQDKPLGDLPLNTEPALPVIDAGQSSFTLPVAKPEEPAPAVEEPETPVVEETVPVDPVEAQAEPVSAVAPETLQSDESVLAEVPPETVEEEAAPVVAEAVEPVAAPADPKIELVFSGECWVSVKDATGEFKMVGIQKEGKRQVLGGSPPYKLVLGNASAVTMLVDGEAFNLNPYVSGNVAKLTYSRN